MDKLEPLIRHKFWIIFAMTLPVVLYGYYSASGKMTEETTSQESTLESTRTGVPKGVNDPNETYADGAKEINDKLQEDFDAQVQYLWELQSERMTWPAYVIDEIPSTYRGEIERDVRYQYQRIYAGVIERLWERIQPWVGEDGTSRSTRRTRGGGRKVVNFKVEWPQKVIIDGHKIPHANFDNSEVHTNKEIWDAQEDVWLLELIFDAIVRTNADAQYVSDAPIRQIDKIELVGGSGESSVTSAGTTTGGGGMGMEEAMVDYEDAMSMGGRGGRGGDALGTPAEVSFNVHEEFGNEIPEADEESDTADTSTSAPGAGYEEGLGGMYGGGMQAGVKMQRYIGPDGFDAFEGPYRERGFYMSVLILQDRIPQFLAELSSSPWPIRIGRFQIGENPHADKQGGGRGGFRRGGYDGGMDYGADYGMEEDYGGGSEGFGMRGGYGGFGGRSTVSQLKLPEYMKLPSSIPDELRADPALVQMDLCGIITMYNPVTDDTVEVTDDGSTEEDFEEQLEETAETPEEAAVEAAEEAAAAAAEAAAGEVPEGADSEAAPPADPASESTADEADAAPEEEPATEESEAPSPDDADTQQ